LSATHIVSDTCDDALEVELGESSSLPDAKPSDPKTCDEALEIELCESSSLPDAKPSDPKAESPGAIKDLGVVSGAWCGVSDVPEGVASRN
jgi:hypothetical protein